MKKIFLAALLLTAMITKAQVGIGTTTPNPGAALEIRDSAKGILIPRIAMAKRMAIANPAEGLMVYQTDSTKGFWYYDGGSWKNVATGSNAGNNGGSPILILTDDITNAQAQAKILAEFGSNTRDIRVIGCTNLTSIDLSTITNAINISIQDNPVLQTIALQNLVSCEGGDGIVIDNCPALSSINLSSLQKLTGWDKSGISLSNTGLTTLSLPLLNRSRGFYISGNPFLTTVSLPSLVTASDINFSFNDAITTLSFPALSSIEKSYGIYINDNPNLAAINFNSLTAAKADAYFLNQNKLTSQAVNALLNKFVSIAPALTGKIFYLDQLTPAPPTGQGITDKTTLETNGNTVNTD